MKLHSMKASKLPTWIYCIKQCTEKTIKATTAEWSTKSRPDTPHELT